MSTVKSANELSPHKTIGRTYCPTAATMMISTTSPDLYAMLRFASMVSLGSNKGGTPCSRHSPKGSELST